MYTELLATRVTLKDYEDKINMYEKEKLRFIDTIEKLVSNARESHLKLPKDDYEITLIFQNGNISSDQETLARTLVKQEENITKLEAALKQSQNLVTEK